MDIQNNDFPSVKVGCDEHEYIDLYAGWARTKIDFSTLGVWMVCKKCLNKRLIRLDMSWEDIEE